MTLSTSLKKLCYKTDMCSAKRSFSGCIVLLIWIAQSIQVHAMRPVEVIIAHSLRTVTLTGNLFETSLEWTDLFSSIPTIPDDSCQVVVYPREAILPVSFISGQGACEVAFVSKDNRILNVIGNIVAGRTYAISTPVIALVLLPLGYCARNSVEVGCFVHIAGVPLIPREPRRPQTAEIAQVRAGLLHNLERFPHDDSVRDDLGVFDLGTQNASAAKPLFEDLVERHPTADRMFHLAVALANTGQIDESVKTAHRAIDLDALHIKSYQLLLKISKHMKTTGEVTDFMQSMLDRHPDFLGLRLELARIRVDSGNWNAADELLKWRSERPEDVAKCQRMRGDLLLRRGEYRAAAECYREYLGVCPYDPHAADLRVFITIHSPDSPQATP